MAAAILMMNMQGAVMAADKDYTIFHYSNDVPFALMTDPKSKLKWNDIWEEFKNKTSITEEDSFQERIDIFTEHMSKYLSNPDILYYDNELTYKTICIGYEQGDMFPKAAIFKMQQVRGLLNIELDKIFSISRENPVFYHVTSKYSNLKLLFGGMSNIIAEGLQEELACQLAKILKTEPYEIKGSKLFQKEYYSKIEQLEKNPEIDKTIRYFTIKDMVKMEENLIDTENLNQSSTTEIDGFYTREVAILTLAEGFKWIRHKDYGA